MDTKISILFYGKTAKTTKNNLLPIYLRVTISGKRFETSTHRHITPTKWSVEAGRVKGNSEEARSINTYLDTLRSQVYAYHSELLKMGKPVTVETFREKWLGVEEKPVMLLEVFQKHNDQVEQLVGKDFAPGTLERYKTSLQHTRSFIQWKYQADDLSITKLNHSFIADYEFWLKTVRSCSHNTTMKYLGNFKKVIHICLKNGWLQRDPFIGFKMSKKEVVREFFQGIVWGPSRKAGAYCFDDLGAESCLKHYGNTCNVMGEVLLSRYDLFVSQSVKTYLTTNLTSSEIEKTYGGRVRSRMREMFNLVSFEKEARDKRR